MDRQDPRRPYWRRADDDDEDADDELVEFQLGHAGFSDRVERFLMQLVTLGLVALALVQTLHTNSTARRMLNLVEGMEGVPWNQVVSWTGEQPDRAQTASAQAEPLLLTVVSVSRKAAPEVRLLVDGRSVGTFANGSLTVPVRAGQVLALDGRQSAESLSFRVVGPPELQVPALGTSVTTAGDLRALGTVQVR